MVVDDNRSLLAFTVRYLARLGYTVLPFNDSEQAWNEFAGHSASYQLVILDVTMPSLSGEALSRNMLERNPGIRLILMSGNPFSPEQVAAADPTQITFLQKPFTPRMLAQAVSGLLGSRP